MNTQHITNNNDVKNKHRNNSNIYQYEPDKYNYKHSLAIYLGLKTSREMNNLLETAIHSDKLSPDEKQVAETFVQEYKKRHLVAPFIAEAISLLLLKNDYSLILRDNKLIK